MRTRRNLKQTQDKLEELLETSKHHLEDQVSQFDALRSLKAKTKMILKHISKKEEKEFKDLTKQIKLLRDDLNCVFEWHDGILVESMQNGGLLLIDEISLANDSVLERLNSVFEQDRTLVVTEKSSQEAVKIIADDKFTMVATMNPSGDFGKKELSPALRNRMTEIWVDSYFQQPELLKMYEESSVSIKTQVPESVDLYLIILKLCEDILRDHIDKAQIQKVSIAIFNLIGYVSCSLGDEFYALKRKAVSIRDILNIIEFMKVNLPRIKNGDVGHCFKHGSELVIVDGVCLGIDTGGQKEQDAIINACQGYIEKVLVDIFGSTSLQGPETDFINSKTEIGVGSFVLPKIQETAKESQFAF
jgi:midasin